MRPQPMYVILMKAATAIGKTASQLAKDVGVTQPTASRWLNGLSEPGPQYWESIEKSLELEPGTLLEAKQALIAAKVHDYHRPNTEIDFETMDTGRLAEILQQVVDKLEQQTIILESMRKDGA